MKGLLNPRFSLKLFPWNVNPFLRRGGSIEADRVKKRFDKLDIVLTLDLNEYLDKMYALNIYDRRSLGFLSKYLIGCEYFVDLGANLGFYSFALARRHMHISCIMVEPDPYSISKILRNMELNPDLESRIALERVAVAGNRSDLDLMINTTGNRGGSSLVFDQRTPSSLHDTVISVNSLTLSDILAKNNVGRSAHWCLKLDIEGYEYPVISRFLADSSVFSLPTAIVIEWTGQGLTGPQGDSPVDLLLEKGYSIIGRDSINYLLARPG